MDEREEFEFRLRAEQEAQQPEMTLGGLAKNAVTDTAENLLSGVDAASKMGPGVIEHLPELVKQGEAFASHPVDSLKEMVKPITHPIDYGYEHPVSQALNVASVVAPILSATGAAETGAQYAGRMGENQMAKLHGTSANQFRQLGRENFGDVMRASYEAGDANLATGAIGREQAIKERIAQLGNDIGDVRAQASEAGPAMSGQEMADAIRARLGPEYAPGGSKFADSGALETQLKNIEAMKQTTPADFAQRVTDINTEAKGKALTQPIGADTDVANQMAQINDEQIAKRLPPEIQEHYQTLKENFGNTKPLDPMELRGEAKEALSNQPGTAFSMAKKVAHTLVGGPKMGAQVGFGAEKALNAVAAHGPEMGVAGITTSLMNRITTNPQSLGKFAAPIMQAAQSGGQQGLAAIHFILSHQYPEYNAMFMGDDNAKGQ